MTFADLEQIKERELAGQKKIVLRCCMAAGCMSSDAKGIKEALEAAVASAGLQDSVEVRGVGCMRLCCEGPLVQADPQDALYVRVTPGNAPDIIEALKGAKSSLARADTKSAFFTKQVSIVLANTGITDPERIESYIALDGYRALHEALTELPPSEMIERVTRSGLRGRGGAGFPTGLKWSTVAKTPGDRKYIICNADEGDPGAFMDRSVLESDPHAVLEGMAIGAYAVGATQAFIYVRAEYPLAISRLQVAIRQAKRVGLLEAASSSPRSISTSTSASARARSCAGRRPRSWLPSRGGAARQARGRRSPPRAGCGAARL